jgi:hypothetical protein
MRVRDIRFIREASYCEVAANIEKYNINEQPVLRFDHVRPIKSEHVFDLVGGFMP